MKIVIGILVLVTIISAYLYFKNSYFVACTADAIQCPNGTWVGRSGPFCKFVCSK